MITLPEVLLKFKPNAKWHWKGTDYSGLVWEDTEETKPTQAEIEAQIPTAEFQIAIEDLRAKRNKLLQDTDYHGISDMTMSSEIQTYRQSLRDLTNGLTTAEEVNAVVFPTKPE